MLTKSNFRLLVVRLGAMGDILHALPAVTALRQMHPGWAIDWVVDPRWRSLLIAEGSTGRAVSMNRPPNPAQPIVDTIHCADTREWRKSPLSVATVRGIKTLRNTLRQCDYDVVLDFQGAIRSAVIAGFSGCRRRIGEENPRERFARGFYTECIVTRGAHVIEQDIELASAIAGDRLTHMLPWLPVDSAAEVWADSLLAEAPSTQPVVLINPGAGWGAKRWPVERYAAVVKELIRKGCRIILNAGPGEEPLAQAISDANGNAITVFQGSLSQLIAITRRISLLIAGDTGPLHLACALGRPVVGIYGPTSPDRNGPFGAQARVLRNPESIVNHARFAEPERGMLAIQPEEVLQAATELIFEGVE